MSHDKKAIHSESEASDSATMWSQDEYHFHGQRANEHVMLVKNQHWVILLPVILIIIVTLIVPAVILLLLKGSVMFYFIIAYLVAVLFYLGHHLYAYFNSVYIVSDQRILNVTQKGFFTRKISEAELSRIQDVSSDVKGVLQTLFGYGDVAIRTASESVLILKNVAQPYDVQQTLVRVLKEVK